MSASDQKLAKWVRHISDMGLPVFSHTARCMASLSSSDESSAESLAQVILRDSSMTARVMRMANSSFYNPLGRRIDTVSFAIVLLGFDTVRNLALSLSLVDTVLSGARHDQAIAELVTSLHAGVQARSFTEFSEQGEPEESFIAAIMHRLGPVAFWCYPQEMDEPVSEAYSRHENGDDAEREVLGFTLNELTQALVKEWKLSAILQQVSADETLPVSAQITDNCINLANALGGGWNTAEMRTALLGIAELVQEPPKTVLSMAQEYANTANDTLAELGFDSAVISQHQSSENRVYRQAADPNERRLGIYRELTAMLAEHVAIPAFISACIEGIYRALDMDVVALAFIDNKTKRLKAKHVLGDRRELLLERFDFPSAPANANIFASLFEQQESILWRPNDDKQNILLFPPELKACIGLNAFLAVPLTYEGKPKALVYADRHNSQQDFSEEDYANFKHFGDLMNIALDLSGR